MPPEEHWFRRYLRAPPMVATRLSVKVINLPSAALVGSGFAAAGGDQGVVDPGSRHVRGIVGLQPQPRVLDLPMGPRGLVSNSVLSGVSVRRHRSGPAIHGSGR